MPAGAAGADPVVDRLAFLLFRLAGRPDTMWDTLTEYEKDAWRHIIRELEAAR